MNDMSNNTDLDSAVRSRFHPRRLSHFNFEVDDLNESSRFYNQVVGFELAYERPLISATFFSNGNTYHDVALMDTAGSMGNGKGARLHHLAFELENEVALVAGYRWAMESGVEFTAAMSHDVAHSVYLNDPDGHGVEIYADVVAVGDDFARGVIDAPKEDWKPGDTPPVAALCYPINPQIGRVNDAVFHALRTCSACIIARDYESMVTFYTRVVGLDIAFGGPEEDFTILLGALGQVDLTLVRATFGLEPGLHHVSVEVGSEEELAAGVDQVRSLDVVLRSQFEDSTRRAVCIEDPSGFLVQLFVPRNSAVSLLADFSAPEILSRV